MAPKNRTPYHEEFQNAPRANNDDSRALPSLALGIIGLIGTLFISIIPLIVGAISVALGVSAMRDIARSDFQKTGYGTARLGAALGGLTILLSIIFMAYRMSK